jgi:hypothetical protein
MECVSTWPLLQRNKIEDSKINIAMQTIADAAIPEDEGTMADMPMNSEETLKPQVVKAEPSEPTPLETTETDEDHPQPLIKSENAEPAGVPLSEDFTDGAVAMTVDGSNLELERGRASERHESQALKLGRMATRVLVLCSVPNLY